MLFDRDNRSVTLTRQGETFLAWARDVLTGWDVVRHTVQEQSGDLQGEVSLYCSVTASYSFLFELLGKLRRDHPRIELKLHTGDPEHAIARVMAGSEDIAIGARPDALPAGLAFKPIARSRLVFIAPAGEPRLRDLGRRRPDPKQWAATPMILPESGLARQRADQWFRDLGVQAADLRAGRRQRGHRQHGQPGLRRRRRARDRAGGEPAGGPGGRAAGHARRWRPTKWACSPWRRSCAAR